MSHSLHHELSVKVEFFPDVCCKFYGFGIKNNLGQ